MNSYSWPTKGTPLTDNCIRENKWRITILTDALFRVEYDEKSIFEDRPTNHIFNRLTSKVPFSTREEDGCLIVETEKAVLSYVKDRPMTRDTLQIRLKVIPFTTWKFGDEINNLKGTARTLDATDGPTPLQDGVCSRDGIAVIDDSNSFVLTKNWFDLRNEESDFYIFCYGHDYKGAVKALYQLTGEPPLLPDYALGNWWCRYYPYTQDEYCALVEKFESKKVPLSVAVIDMDWHITKNLPKESLWEGMQGSEGWTGYTWNTELFPDYRKFLSSLHQHGLKTSLNLHPAQGVCCHEAMYEEMACAMGVDSSCKKPIKFDILNPTFVKNYFDILHHPYEKDGVDFWWMDWQQGTDYWWIHDEEHPENPLEKTADPLWLLSHLHILDIMKNGKRPMFFSRYAGVGSHRYPIGFSGDAGTNWAGLAFQIYFTSTASNIGYSWWSHDIGGNSGGYRDDELSTRWLQFGVFSPILRLHSNDSLFTGKEPWKYRYECEVIQENFLRLRHRLFPYIYTMNYRNTTELEPMIQPMYYEYPESYDSYDVPCQYMFGPSLMVAAIAEKSDPISTMGHVTAWFPKGDWYDVFTGLRYTGDRKVELYRFLDEYPVFAKAGAIVPLQDDVGDNLLGRRENMTVYFFPGKNGSFELYEDGGDGSEWQNGTFAKTKLSMAWNKNVIISIAPAKGDLSLLPEKRNWTLALRGFSKDVKILSSSSPVKAFYDEETSTLNLKAFNVSTADGFTITLDSENFLADNSMARERAVKIMTRAQTINDWKDTVWGKIAKFAHTNNLGLNERNVLWALREMKSIYDYKK